MPDQWSTLLKVKYEHDCTMVGFQNKNKQLGKLEPMADTIHLWYIYTHIWLIVMAKCR